MPAEALLCFRASPWGTRGVSTESGCSQKLGCLDPRPGRPSRALGPARATLPRPGPDRRPPLDSAEEQRAADPPSRSAGRPVEVGRPPGPRPGSPVRVPATDVGRPVPGQPGLCRKVPLIFPQGRPGLGFCGADTSAQSVRSQPPLIQSTALVAP